MENIVMYIFPLPVLEPYPHAIKLWLTDHVLTNRISKLYPNRAISQSNIPMLHQHLLRMQLENLQFHGKYFFLKN